MEDLDVSVDKVTKQGLPIMCKLKEQSSPVFVVYACKAVVRRNTKAFNLKELQEVLSCVLSPNKWKANGKSV